MRITGKTLLFSEEAIRRRVQELAAEIDAVYGDEGLVVVGVLKGACLFMADLVRALHIPRVELDFVRLSSYGNGLRSSGEIVFSKDVETALEGRHVLVVEDIVDSGRSMAFLLASLASRKARSVRLAVLVDKRERREVAVTADFTGFVTDGGFLVGYGLDFAEQYRQLPAIYALHCEET